MLQAIKEAGRPIVKRAVMERPVGEKGLQATITICGDRRHRDNESLIAGSAGETRGAFQHQSVLISGVFARVAAGAVSLQIFEFDIWGISDYHVEPTVAHDAVELRQPVERLVAFAPFLILLGLIGIDAVFSR